LRPPQSPKGDFDYVLLRVATNSRIVFIVKILIAPFSLGLPPLGDLGGLGLGVRLYMR